MGTLLMSESQTVIAPGKKPGISCSGTSGEDPLWEPPYSLVLPTSGGCVEKMLRMW